jgi:serine/threonine-protein kinase
MNAKPGPFGVVHDPSASRRMVYRAANEEEARADLQKRIASLFKVMFWSLALLVGFLWALYTIYGEPVAPKRRDLVYIGSAIGLGAMAFIWRGLLVRRPLPVSALHAIDLVYSLGIGTAFGAAAVVQRELRPSAYMSLIYTTYTVFARALMMPSTARRTATACAVTYAPLVVSSVVVASTTTTGLPKEAFVGGCVLIGGVSIALATAGSHIIYGLRRKVSEAQQLGAYILDKKIGEGGMGTVYHAHHIMLRRPTAVKRLRADHGGAESLERFEREVKHMSQLTHPNTVAVYDYGRSADGTFYYAMEYLGGGIDLEKLVARHGPQPPARVARILAQVCGALQEAHDSGFIHRDIKPANIILCERGNLPDIAKVVDFGLAKEITADTGASVQVVLGTPGYVAPETITDPSNVGPGVDLYALGAVGYILLTGKRVFEGKSGADVCIKHLTLPPPPPSSVTDNAIPAELEAIILRCLAKTPAERFASAGELATALRALAGDWSDARAREWWHEFRRREADAAITSEAATETITVDLGSRRGAA